MLSPQQCCESFVGCRISLLPITLIRVQNFIEQLFRQILFLHIIWKTVVTSAGRKHFARSSYRPSSNFHNLPQNSYSSFKVILLYLAIMSVQKIGNSVPFLSTKIRILEKRFFSKNILTIDFVWCEDIHSLPYYD